METVNYQIITLEGNIGSGKSTLLELLRKKYSNNPQVIFLKEPISDWEKIKDAQGNTILQKFYGDQEKYSFAFQMMAYISRLKILKDAVKFAQRNPSQQFYIITERCLHTDKYVFAKMLFDQNKIEDVCYQIYNTWFEEFSKEFIISKSIYIITKPEICYERIHKRCRVGEEIIPLEYLERCDSYHNNFLEIFPDNSEYVISETKLVIIGNDDIYKSPHLEFIWTDMIDKFIFRE